MNLEKIEKIAKEICFENGVSLYDINLHNTRKGKVLAVYIIKIDGVSVEDWKKISRELEEKLDNKDLIKGKYFLEVSSPGLKRPLKLKKHYVSAINEKVRIIYTAEKNKTAKVIGILKEVNPEEIIILTKKGYTLNIKFSNIKKASTYFEFDKKRS